MPTKPPFPHGPFAVMTRHAAVIAALACLAAPAHAETPAEATKPSPGEASRTPVMLELSPFVSFGGAREPKGPRGWGVAGEWFRDDHVSFRGMLSQSTLRRKAADVARARGSDDDARLVADRDDAYALTGSAVYYFDAPREASSFYLSAGLALGFGKARYAYGATTWKDEYTGGVVLAEAGYLWRFGPGLFFRLSGTAWADAFAKHSPRMSEGDPARTRGAHAIKKDPLPDFFPTFRVGLGKAF